MQKYISTRALSDQLNDFVIFKPQNLEAKVLAIEVCNYFEFFCVDNDPTELQLHFHLRLQDAARLH